MGRNRNLFLGLVTSVAVLFSTAVFSGETLKVEVQQDFHPFTKSENGQVSGVYVEILQGAMKKAGMSAEISGKPWKRIVKMTDENQLDLSLPWRSKPERFKKYHMVGPFTSSGSGTYFWTTKDKKISWNDISDLKKYTIGYIDGFAYPKVFEENKANLNVQKKNTSTKLLIKQLLGGRFDMLISDETVLGAEAAALNAQDKLIRVGKSLDSVQRYVALNKSREDLAGKLQAAIDNFKKTDDYKTILKKYGLN